MTSERYIGGFFDASVHDRFRTLVQRSSEWFPNKVRGGSRALFESGADACAAILNDAAVSSQIGNIWIPENFCRESLARIEDKLVQPLKIKFFRLDAGNRKLRGVKANDLVLYVHYNRFDPEATALALEEVRAIGAKVVEDFVMAPLDISRSSSNYSFNSLRKFSNLPVAVAYGIRSSPDLSSERSPYAKLMEEAESDKARYLSEGGVALESRYLEKQRNAEKRLRTPRIWTATPEAKSKMEELDYNAIHASRKRNHKDLVGRLSVLSELTYVPGDYTYAMFEAKNRDALRSFLFSKGIFPAVHWLDAGSFEAKNFLSFHIDQRYDAKDMARTAEAVEEFYANHRL